MHPRLTAGSWAVVTDVMVLSLFQVLVTVQAAMVAGVRVVMEVGALVAMDVPVRAATADF